MTNEQLVTRIKAGENVANNMELLYEQTKAFIHMVAMRYQGQAELEDLEQEGYLALYPAIDGYNPDQGVKFLTYAEYHIRQRMQRYVWMNSNSVRLSYHGREKVLQYKRICNTYMLQYGREPSEHAVAVRMGVGREQVREIQKIARMERVGSLDGCLTEDEEMTLGNTIPSVEDLEGDAVDRMYQEALRATLWPLVDALPGKQGPVIRARYQGGMGLQEIAEYTGTNKAEVQKLQAKALKGLRRSSTLNQLRPFLPEAMESMAYRGSGAERFNQTWTSSTERVALML